MAAQRFHPDHQGSISARGSSMGIFALGRLPELGLQDPGLADDCSIAPVAPQAQSSPAMSMGSTSQQKTSLCISVKHFELRVSMRAVCLRHFCVFGNFQL